MEQWEQAEGSGAGTGLGQAGVFSMEQESGSLPE